MIKGLPVSYTFGVIGDEYKRIRIKITDATKDFKNPNRYYIKGKSKVGNNLESFEGTITFKNIRQIKARTLDEITVAMPTIYEGIVSGVYEFYEPKNRHHSGVFKGNYQGMFQITEENKVFYNDLDTYRDSYINNMYVGTWTDYQTNLSKICKWGDFRVPDVPTDFDLGAGEFSPNEKYNNRGWKTYHDAFFTKDAKAMEVEEGAWWE